MTDYLMLKGIKLMDAKDKAENILKICQPSEMYHFCLYILNLKHH